MTDTLSREQILAEPAGRRLDEWVAVHVLKIGPKDVRVRGSTETVCVYTGNPAVLSDGWWSAAELRRHGEPKPYSTDIAAAWEAEAAVPRELQGRYVEALVNLEDWSRDYFPVKWGEWFVFVHASPEKRCKAALLAVLGL